MQCNDYITHYKTDAEVFDYFETKSHADADSARRIQQAVAREIDRDASGYVLDIGSGNGWLTNEKSIHNLNIISCDISLKNLKLIKSNVKGSFLAVVADAHRLPFRNECIDSIIASEVIEHLNSPASAIREFYRIINNHSNVILSTPYKEIIRTSLCIHCNRETPLNAHLHSFDEKKLSLLFDVDAWKDFRYSIIQNKIFISLRVSSMFRFLPYTLWRTIDRIFSLFFRKANTIIVTVQKSSSL